jgi:NAD(P)-dependent dehydrogenase (short-subunit alcohol dehydrogenase family)
MSDQRVVVVTGASRGIGLACAEAFARNGDAVAGLSSSGACPADRALSVRCDVADSAAVDAAFTEVEASLGACEVLVANAGVTDDQLAVRMSDEAWRRVLDVNLTGSFLCARRALRRMLRAHAGRIVFVSSVGAFVGLPGQANYAASKAGLVGLARALAREVASRGITVNVVAPGLIDTEMTRALGDARLDAMMATVPLGRLGGADDVASAVTFLASPAASYVTGAVLAVDGGLAMGL